MMMMIMIALLFLVLYGSVLSTLYEYCRSMSLCCYQVGPRIQRNAHFFDCECVECAVCRLINFIFKSQCVYSSIGFENIVQCHFTSRSRKFCRDLKIYAFLSGMVFR